MKRHRARHVYGPTHGGINGEAIKCLCTSGTMSAQGGFCQELVYAGPSIGGPGAFSFWYADDDLAEKNAT